MDRRPLRVAIIGDVPAARRHFRSWLTEGSIRRGLLWDVDCVELSSSISELSILDAEPVDAILLCDHHDASRALDIFEALKVRSIAVPVVALLDSEDAATAVALVRAGAFDSLTPTRWSSTIVVDTLASALEASTIRRCDRQRARDLEQQNLTLIAEKQKLEEFCHTLSHELKTPLTSAREFICLMAEGIAGPLTIDQIEYLTICRNSCDQLNRITDDLVDLSRIDTGKLSIRPREFTTETLVRELVLRARPRAERSVIRIETDLDEASALVSVFADLDRAKQVLGNLIDNALKFTPSGGTIKVSARPETNGTVTFSVRDTGPGIAPAERGKIFDRLYQTSGASGSSEVGMGLGLNLCKELIELHGGKIWLENTAGEGSEFCFTLPIAHPESNPQEAPNRSLSPPRSSSSMTTLRSPKASASA